MKPQRRTASRQAIDAKIRRGIEELENGDGIPEDELDTYLERIGQNG